MILIDADAIGAVMPPSRLVEALREGHRTGTMGEVGRMFVQGPDGPNAALCWTGWRGDLGNAVKMATLFPGNAADRQKPNIHSVVLLFAPDDGVPVAAIHGESFTRMKTAADSALGADLLARRDVRRLAILGAGGQAEMQVRFLMAVRPSITAVAVWNRSPHAAGRLVSRLAAHGVDCRAVDHPEAAVRDADLVSCVTGSSAPVLRGAWLRPGCHVDLVGAYTPEARESDDEVVRRGRLFADSMRFGVAQCGDYAQPIAAGVIRPEDVRGDLYDLCSTRIDGRCTADDITVFKNGGGGHLDLMAAVAFAGFRTAGLKQPMER